ncbi:hypothetical protein [Spirosoma pomorum]
MKSILVALLTLFSLAVQAQTVTPVISYSFVNQGGLKFEQKVVTLPAQPASESAISCQRIGENIVCDTIPARAALPESKTATLTGRIVGIETDAAPNPLIAVPHKRKLELISLTEDAEQELTIFVQANYYTPEGERMTDAIARDASLSDDARTQKLRLFQSFQFKPKRTKGSWVNPVTGAFVPVGTAGAIPENLFYQRFPIEGFAALGVPLTAEQKRYPDLLRKLMVVYMIRSLETRTGI